MTLLNPNSTKLALSIALLLHAAMVWWLWHEPIHKVELAASVESYLSMTLVAGQTSSPDRVSSEPMQEVSTQAVTEATVMLHEADVSSPLIHPNVKPVQHKIKTSKENSNNRLEQSVNSIRKLEPDVELTGSSVPDQSETVAHSSAQTIVADRSSWQAQYDSQVVAALKRCTRYPEAAREEAIFGRVLVSFVMQPNGKAVKAQLLSPAHELLESAALEAIECLPLLPFPAEADADKRSYQLPIAFYIE